MKGWLVSGILFYCIFFNSFKEPEDCTYVFDLPSRDEAFLNQVYFCKPDSGDYYYYSVITTSVCNDENCKLAILKVIWDLAGNYTKFETLPGKPLTKNDHIPFTITDYDKLHSTLQNATSILGDKTKDELLEKDSLKYSEKIDGFTGATSKEIKEAVVDGALYSTYTLWHLVNGDVRKEIRKYTQSTYDEQMEAQLLSSANPRTVLFGLKNLDESSYPQKFTQLVQILQRSNPLVNFYITKRLTPEIFQNPENRAAIQNVWESLDKNTQSILSKLLEKPTGGG
ncbi:MAG: hypothetical protein CMO01_02460 [Thalassobius sp.]|nr:hypothetical protein [Thalassovita sp.]